MGGVDAQQAVKGRACHGGCKPVLVQSEGRICKERRSIPIGRVVSCRAKGANCAAGRGDKVIAGSDAVRCFRGCKRRRLRGIEKVSTRSVVCWPTGGGEAHRGDEACRGHGSCGSRRSGWALWPVGPAAPGAPVAPTGPARPAAPCAPAGPGALAGPCWFHCTTFSTLALHAEGAATIRVTPVSLETHEVMTVGDVV